MTGVLAAEARKLLTTPSSRWLIAAGPLLAAGVSVLVLVIGASGKGGFRVEGVVTEIRSDADLRDFATLAAATTFLALALGVTEATSEFRYATIVRAVLARPRRWQTVVAKTAVITVGGAVLTLTATLACFGVAAVWLAAHGQSVPMGGRSAAILLELAVTGGLDAAAGAAVGFLVRNQATALVVVLGWAFLAESIVAGLFIDAKPWLPVTGAAQAMLSGPAEHLFTPLAGGLLLAAYALALTAFAAVALQRRDVG
jgi:ABC-2 type transport system permease protein